ncbi:uncharacterized protein CC84DRAFT_359872 [Paraphaeosphaeria sporulosa]|uniref:N-acetyltransferase domain-containing protein n=1 Tax=Paraphaeosphaeria sporulosa TaxID=1460663 RepID=A0A177BZZ1_9PLEO|nr:uncharacterized protein CC84DRAFT_359872 [Paraphaeosphaeria sporulosa]OAG00128.1 hypothetical protein CC84DRAFT_359872 [Paraphaeosphaeria sporulosa]
MTDALNDREWRRSTSTAGQTYVVSTSRNLPHDFVQKAFDNPAMYWARPIAPDQMKTMLDHSCTLGMYEASGSERRPIGMARMITDYVTFAYLTDVYLLEEFRGHGLGQWLVECCREVVLAIPALRRVVLLTDSEQAKQLYRRELGMSVAGIEETTVAMTVRQAKLQALFGSSGTTR